MGASIGFADLKTGIDRRIAAIDDLDSTNKRSLDNINTEITEFFKYIHSTDIVLNQEQFDELNRLLGELNTAGSRKAKKLKLNYVPHVIKFRKSTSENRIKLKVLKADGGMITKEPPSARAASVQMQQPPGASPGRNVFAGSRDAEVGAQADKLGVKYDYNSTFKSVTLRSIDPKNEELYYRAAYKVAREMGVEQSMVMSFGVAQNTGPVKIPAEELRKGSIQIGDPRSHPLEADAAKQIIDRIKEEVEKGTAAQPHTYKATDMKGLTQGYLPTPAGLQENLETHALMILTAEGVKPAMFIESNQISDMKSLKETAQKMGLASIEVGADLVVSKDQQKARQLAEALAAFNAAKRPDGTAPRELSEKVGLLIGYPPADVRAFANEMATPEGREHVHKTGQKFKQELSKQSTDMIETVGGFTFHSAQSATAESTVKQAQLCRETLERVAPEIADALRRTALAEYAATTGPTLEMTAEGILTQKTWEGLVNAVGRERANKLLSLWQEYKFSAEAAEKRAQEVIEEEGLAKKRELEQGYGMGL